MGLLLRRITFVFLSISGLSVRAKHSHTVKKGLVNDIPAGDGKTADFFCTVHLHRAAISGILSLFPSSARENLFPKRRSTAVTSHKEFLDERSTCTNTNTNQKRVCRFSFHLFPANL